MGYHDLNKIKELNINNFLTLAGAVVDQKKSNSQKTWYLCPYRDEKVASFAVNNSMNRFYDHGGDNDKGDIIKLYMKMYMVDFKTAIDRLGNGIIPEYGYYQPPTHKKPLVKGIDIVSIKPLINNSLIKYIQSRGINIDLARLYCEEAVIKFPNSEKTPNKEYTTISFENISGGYEFRNDFFKLGNSPKDVSIIRAEPLQLNLFEGFFDFMSALEDKQIDKFQHDTMILNSLSFIERANDYEYINLYIDYGTAAEKSLLKLTGVINDERGIFKGFGDYNDFLKAKKGLT